LIRGWKPVFGKDHGDVSLEATEARKPIRMASMFAKVALVLAGLTIFVGQGATGRFRGTIIVIALVVAAAFVIAGIRAISR
jgi:hypothetical protein